MDRIPKTMAIVGAGVIECEYASIFTALGVETAFMDSRDRLLPFLDVEICCRLRSLGLEFHPKDRLARTERIDFSSPGARSKRKLPCLLRDVVARWKSSNLNDRTDH
jgi:Pyridine nucleotide-disulphide oxidoreductase